MQDLHRVEELAGALEGFVAFPDLQTSIEAILTNGDRVGVRCRSRRTHTGDFMGIEATGRSVAFGGAGINRIVNGAITETWTSTIWPR